MTGHVLYRDRRPIEQGACCEICLIPTPQPMADHCHEHGWVRGVVCRQCNAYMSLIDLRITPRAPSVGALVAFANRCPDCAHLTVADLGPTSSLNSLRRLRPVEAAIGGRLRLPSELHERLKAAADLNRRSLHAEILWRLEHSEQPEQDSKVRAAR